ncbi:MAG: N-6 DNA methylase, partial [Armatimonadia bacterium]
MIYAILRRLCFAKAKLGRETVPQRLSYQSLDIEQIGTVYEGLIDYTVKRAPEDETLVIFKGKDQALRPMSEVGERLADSGYLQEQTGFSASRVQKLLAQQELDGEAPDDLPAELLPYAGFFEGAIPPNHLYVAHQSGLRKGQGTYYTPKWITSFICERTLEPLVYEGEGEGRRLKAPEEILALKVCDPAMGSGAFLVQACRYLADRLVDAWDRLAVEKPEQILTMPYGNVLNGGPREMALPESHDEAVMWARRFVAEHCLYGVDLNPLAVELAKMSLWLITLSKDKPFEFFDHKLKHGNSLIGSWTSDLERYPAAAWDRKGAEGAVKEALKQIKKDAKTQADRQAKDRAKGIVPLIGVDVAALRAETAAEMREIDEVSTFDPQQKERLYRRNIEQDERYQALKRMFDTWCALWFWPLQGGEMSADLPLAFAYPELLGHYLGAERLMADPERLERWAETVGKVWERERFFHWELEFPEVFEEGRGGFDAVVMNPPWERIKLQENEFFAMRDPLIAHAPNAAARKRLIEQLPQTNPALWQEFSCDKQRAELASLFVRESGHFPLTGCGDTNLYPVFAEHARRLIKPLGQAGMVIPSGIATDDTTKFFFQDLMDTHSLRALYDFENREGAFPAVDSRMKFSLTLLQGAGHGASEAEFAFFLTNRGHLDDPVRRFGLSGEDIALLNPNTRTCPIFRTVRDAELTKALYRRHSVLKREDVASTEGWGVAVRRLVDANTEGDVLLAIGTNADNVPLYEGKMVDIYNHRASSVTINPANLHRPAQAEASTEEQLSGPSFVPSFQYEVALADATRSVPAWYSRRWAIAYKNVTSSTNARTCTAAALPWIGSNFSLRVLFTPVTDTGLLCCLLADLNSFVFDYVVRQKIPSTNLADFVMYQLT